ncbi:MAG: HD domain-containing protein [Oscillospiraceae bacterium]|nr:HD domain-containing protein [Oscillospiraceae bacterium]
MMNLVEEAIIYATVLHQGKLRKFGGIPYILHPLEVAQILSTMTEDPEVITAGILHDVVEDTDGTLVEIEKRFGKRVALLVSSESEQKYPEEDPGSTWKRRKEDSLTLLKNSTDIGVKMLWLADKLSNIRSLAGIYSERGEAMWQDLNQSDPAMQCWYYKTVAEQLELSLNKTGAFKELIKHINSIWPGTFDSEKAKFKKYREVSVDGCRRIGHGAKGEVFCYDDEVVIKVYNENNTYHDVEREIALSRRAFILGIPTAISFGIVSVGDRYGAMYELVDADTISECIARAPGQVAVYGSMMAELAHSIHAIQVPPEDGFPDVCDRLRSYVSGGIDHEDEALAERCLELLGTLTPTDHLVHGDFHTNNVFLQKGEPLLIDMDRLATGHPIAEISDLYYFYVVLGEDDPSVVENFMGYSYATAQRFFHAFLQSYLGTDDPEKLREVIEKASLMCYVRMIRRLRNSGGSSAQNRRMIAHYLEKIEYLTDKLDTLLY